MEIYELINSLKFTSVIWEILTPLCFSCADFITGYIQALINKNVSSQKMRIGLLHKILLLLVIVLSFIIASAFNMPYISSVVCIYIVIMEITSIVENLKKAGIDTGKLESVLKQAEEKQTEEKIENKEETKENEL